MKQPTQGKINKNTKRTRESQRDTKVEFALRQISPLTDRQSDMMAGLSNNNHTIGYGSAGTGKAQPLTSKVLTPSGWKFMGDVVVGDVVSTPNGSTSTVIGIFPQGEKEIYEVTFSDGSSTRCCLDHLWECNVPVNFRKYNKSYKKILTTKDMINFLMEKKIQPNYGNISIDLISGHETPKVELPIPPYLLGVLIGDGSITNGVMFTSADQQIIDNVGALLRDDYYINSTIGPYDFRITYKIKDPKNRQNYYSIKLQELGLYGKKSNDKFIPDMYKHSCITDRIKLLQGLLDTDGTVGKKGDVSFSTSSYNLAKDVQEIVWSIGGKSCIRKRKAGYTKNGVYIKCQDCYTVSISYTQPKDLFTLERKVQRCSDTYQPKQLRRTLKSIELVSVEQAQCILLDSEEHLYITDDYIITHNTMVALYSALVKVLVDKTHDKVIILRSPLSVNHQGYLPGTLEEKEAVYERPYVDIVDWLMMENGAYYKLKEKNLIEFQTTSYIRGLTWDNCVVIADETQNMLWEEINTIATRKGLNTILVFLGDLKQDDLTPTKRNQQSGMSKLIHVGRICASFCMVNFTPEDIVRDEFVKEWILAVEQIESIPSK